MPGLKEISAGLIVTEEINSQKREAEGIQATSNPNEPKPEEEIQAQVQPEILTVQAEAEIPDGAASTITSASNAATTVRTEDMSAEHAEDNHGKSEGWSAELEQPKITSVIEAQVICVLTHMHHCHVWPTD